MNYTSNKIHNIISPITIPIPNPSPFSFSEFTGNYPSNNYNYNNTYYYNYNQDNIMSFIPNPVPSSEFTWNMYLNNVICSTKVYWCIPKYSFFHELISTIISQRISFNLGRSIRQKLFTKLKLEQGESMTPLKLRSITYQQFKEINMPEDKRKIIDNIVNSIPDDLWNLSMCNVNYLDMIFNNINNIPGVGPWTIGALKIKLFPHIYPDILLANDKWINARYASLRPELKGAITILQHRDPYLVPSGISLSEVSCFLWRIEKEGINKLNDGIPLEKSDFV